MKQIQTELFSPIKKSEDPFEEIHSSIKQVSLGLKNLPWKKRIKLIWAILTC